MKMIFGANSAVQSDLRLKNGYTMYDWVMRKNCFPAFWGRTLLGEHPITREEVDFLKMKNCRIALVIRDLTELGVPGIDGTKDAQRAVQAAKALGVPQHAGIVLFAELQSDWSVNHNWMITFAQTLKANGYDPGFIGNTDSSKNFNFDRQCSHYVQATESVHQFDAVYGATEPKQNGQPEAWQPFCPSALDPEDMSLWECGTIHFNDMEVHETYARDKKVLERMW